MKHSKRAFSLAFLEIKTSILYLLLFIPVFVVFTLLFTTSFSPYLKANNVGFDFLFILIFSVIPIWLRNKHFQIQKIQGSVWASPTYVMQMQLPIPTQILAKSRLITYLFFSIPFHALLLLLIYLFTPALQVTLTPFVYFSFSIIWICFGVYGGLIMPASDVGDIITVKTMTISSIGLITGFIIALTFFHLVLGYGIVYWTIMIAQNYPLSSIILSIFLAILGFRFWQQMMIRKTKQFDYY